MIEVDFKGILLNSPHLYECYKEDMTQEEASYVFTQEARTRLYVQELGKAIERIEEKVDSIRKDPRMRL